MKLVDANLLLYPVNEDAPLHAKARSWLEAVLSGSETVGFAWVVLLAFLRLSAELCSCDSDFSRFPGLRWRDPLTDAD